MILLRIFLIVLLIIFLTMNVIVLQLMYFMQTTMLQPSVYDNLMMQQEFYGLLRHFVLMIARENLRFGHTGFPYLEEALTEEFLRAELLELGNGLGEFFAGQRSELPVIPVYRLKDRVLEVLGSNGSEEDRWRLVQFWFDPLMDEVRFSYFTASEPFWQLRMINTMRVRYFLLPILSAVLLAGLLMLVSMNIKTGLLWSGVSLASAGGITAGMGLWIIWLFSYSPPALMLVERAAAYGFLEQGIESLLQALGARLSLRINGIAVLMLAAGCLLIQWIPIQEG